MANDLTLTLTWDELEKADIGPAMQALTKMQQRFVWALTMQGMQNQSEAARLAGFADNGGGTIRVTAHRLMHDPRVNAAIQEVSRQRLQHHALLGVNVLIEIANGQHGAKAGDRLKAIDSILGRAGIPMVSEVQHTDPHRKSDAELVAEIDAKLKTVGMRLAELLGPKQIIDASYSVVDDGKSGLEDLL